jgi:predicted N-formylglutamate amidohydrolase
MMDSVMAEEPPNLLGPEDPAPVELVNPRGGGHALLVCDHASNRVPERLGSLGLGRDMLQGHIAWDPGAADVARRLAAELDCPLVLSGYSRLVVDCNRPPGHPGSMPGRSAGVAIPGNEGLSSTDRTSRIDALFRPYHDAIAGLLDARSHKRTALISIHSFTPVLNGAPRPWQLGISHWRDNRLAELLLGALRRVGDLTLGDNEPYPIEEEIDYTIPMHGERRALPSVMIEIRQDEIRAPADAVAWAARIASAYGLIEDELPRLFERPRQR